MQRLCKCPPGSAFHWAEADYVQRCEWTHLQRAAESQAKQTAAIEQARASGEDRSPVLMMRRGLSTSHLAPERMRR